MFSETRRTSVFEGAKLDPLNERRALHLHRRLGWFDGQRFDWLKPRCHRSFWLGSRASHPPGPDWRMVGRDRRGTLSISGGRQARAPREARPTAVYTVKDGLAAPQVYRLFEDSRGNVWVSTISATAVGLARWESATGRMRNCRRSPGLSSLKDDWAARSFGEDAAGQRLDRLRPVSWPGTRMAVSIVHGE